MQTPETLPTEPTDDSTEFVILQAPDRAAAEALGADIDDTETEAEHV